MIFVGLSTSAHDPALAIVDAAGAVLFAEGAERPLQTKRAWNCPADALPYLERLIDRYCPPDVPVVLARTWSRWHGFKVQLATFLHTLLAPLFGRLRSFAAFVDRYQYQLRLQENALLFGGENLRFALANRGSRYLRHVHRYQRGWLGDGGDPEVRRFGREHTAAPRVRVRHYEHHLTHAVAACTGSPFSEAVCAVVDGFGETSSTAYFLYRDGRVRPLRVAQRSDNSLGFFYAAVCAACGFDPDKGEEWKVMGLAPYGRVDERVREVLAAMVPTTDLRIGGLGRFFDSRAWAACQEIDRADLAATGQAVFEDRMVRLLSHLCRLDLSRNLVLTGGCALNSSCNGKLLRQTGFDALHVDCAPGDDGTAVGAALLAWQESTGAALPGGRVRSPYLGSSLSAESLGNLATLGLPGRVSHHPDDLHVHVAGLLAEGKIVGWARGRAEFGPRALGNRSILADPRPADVKDRLNSRVKFREEFRPFAPAVLHEFGPEVFEDYQESPYMERTLRFRPEAAARMPGVVHVDGTGRLQTVKRDWNQPFHALLAEFHARTGVPVLLNTSFNVMGKPILHSVEDAVATFFTTGLDALVLDDYLLLK